MAELFVRVKNLYQQQGGVFADPIMALTQQYADPRKPTPKNADLPSGGTGANLTTMTLALLDLSLPDAGKYVGPRPIIVWLHAGGWEYGTRRDPAPFADVAVFAKDWGFRLDEVKVPVRWWHGDADSLRPCNFNRAAAAAHVGCGDGLGR